MQAPCQPEKTNPADRRRGECDTRSGGFIARRWETVPPLPVLTVKKYWVAKETLAEPGGAAGDRDRLRCAGPAYCVPVVVALRGGCRERMRRAGQPVQQRGSAARLCPSAST